MYKYINDIEYNKICQDKREIYTLINVDNRIKYRDEYVNNIVIILSNKEFNFKEVNKPMILVSTKEKHTYTLMLVTRKNKKLSDRNRNILSSFLNELKYIE